MVPLMKLDRFLTHSAGLLLFGLCGTGLCLAQDTGKPAPEPVQEEEEMPEIQIPGLNAPDDPQQEMIRIFHEVERTLESIDIELFDASAGRIPMPEGKESGIERLLRSHGEKSDQAVAGIERILELAQQMGGSCKNGMAGQQGNPKPGQSPLDQERQRGPTEGEKTPEAPKPGEQEKQGEQPGQPKPEGETPDDGGENPPAGENVPSAPRSDESGEPVAPGGDADRWGALPERVQRVFNNQITDDLPIQYRDWIDSYYRRLNKVR
jgi:hypothetical protein